MIGQTVSHYRVLEKLGSGGMGEVFKARDTRLNRFVALKVLRSERLSEESRKQRFIQEAQAASALNHPNIVSIHDIGRQDGVDFMVMEYVAGSTLDTRIPRNGIRLNDALRIAVQIAEGLRSAHAAGIIHRDLKPSNVMIADDGHVKILDFGLAKLTEPAPSEDENTLTVRPETEEGVILGTTAYMSPEQAEGRKLDARTDIFSFGVVLYEMLAGRRPFTGDTRVSLISAIVKEEPKPLDNIPPDLDKIIQRCLRKDREKRIQHIDDVKLALDEVREDSESGKFDAAPKAAKVTPKRWLWIAGAAAMTAVLGAGWYMASHRNEKPAIPLGPVLRQLTFDRGLTTEPTFWPAGNMIAYASDRGGDNLDIWVQHLETKESKRLTTHEADDREPAFSPDGSRVAFRSERDGGGIYVISTLGVGERKIADGGRRPRFSPDGQWIAYYVGTYGFDNPFATYGPELRVVPSAGGTSRRLAKDFVAVSAPVWSSDGKYLLAYGASNLRAVDWYVIPIDGGSPVKTGTLDILSRQKVTPQGPMAWDGETILFAAQVGDARNLWRIRIDPRTFKMSEQAQRITTGNGIEGDASQVGNRLVFSSIQENSDIWALPLEANTARVTGEVQRITDDVAPNFSASVSADGKQLVVHTDLGEAHQIVHMDLAARKEQVIATAASFAPAPRISPDGAMVAFTDAEPAAEPGRRKNVIRLLPSTGGPSRIACENCQVRNWAADNRQLVVTRFNPKNRVTGLFDVRTNAENLFLAVDGSSHSAPITSPNGKWIVFYTPIANERSMIRIAPVRQTVVSGAEQLQLTDGRSWDAVPEFSPDGKILYFLSHRDGFRCHWAMRMDPATGKRIGDPFPVQHHHSARRSPGYVRPGRVANAVARDKIVFTMAERTGNIWIADLQ